MPEPALTLRDAYNAADPAVPLPSGDPRYVDCTDVRGNRDVVQQMFDTVTWSDSDTAQLLTGHRGCGKSTELLRLKTRLEEAGYTIIYFEADEDLDVNDIFYSDLLLAIARRIEDELREEHNIKLDAKLLKSVQRWFAEVLYTEEGWRQVERELAAEVELGVGLPVGVPLLARLLARVTGQIKTGHDIREEIRRKLDPQISLLIENVNMLIHRATIQLRRQNRRGLVLLIDNLDRITLRELDVGRTSHEALYIDHGVQLRALKCHVVYTVPISMVYSPTATQLKAVFPPMRGRADDQRSTAGRRRSHRGAGPSAGDAVSPDRPGNPLHRRGGGLPLPCLWRAPPRPDATGDLRLHPRPPRPLAPAD